MARRRGDAASHDPCRRCSEPRLERSPLRRLPLVVRPRSESSACRARVPRSGPYDLSWPERAKAKRVASAEILSARRCGGSLWWSGLGVNPRPAGHASRERRHAPLRPRRIHSAEVVRVGSPKTKDPRRRPDGKEERRRCIRSDAASRSRRRKPGCRADRRPAIRPVRPHLARASKLRSRLRAPTFSHSCGTTASRACRPPRASRP